MMYSIVFRFIYWSALSAAVSASLDIDVDVDRGSGAFAVTVNGRRWFRSGETFLRADGARHSSADGTLLLGEVRSSAGSDALGPYTSTDMMWQTALGGVRMDTSVKQYERCVVFEQSFPGGAADTSAGDADGLVSGFPSFSVSDDDEPAGFAHWISWYWLNQSSDPSNRRRLLEAKGFESPVYGRWDSSSLLYGGIGGSGVTSVFSRDGAMAAVLAPLDAFMAASQLSTARGQRSMGVMGNVTDIPAGFSMSFIVYFGEGINAAVREWGDAVLRAYNKPGLTSSGQVAADVSLSYLGYTTDNGAYYYYQTVPGKNYQDTILDIKTYADSLELPYRYILLDSWWYYRGENGGVTNWEPRPDVFPDGVEYVYNQTGWLVQAHNRYWSDETVYAKQNGGEYEFVLEEDTGGAAPAEQRFWDDFLGGRSAWGLRVYEQDWLWNEYNQYVSGFLTSLSRGRAWLQQMASGAEKNGLTIQYCMPHIRHVLQSVEFPVVTQARASDDYKPGEDTEQWRIGGQSVLFSALGLAPSKDGFWSTSVQPGNPYGEDNTEPTPRLQAAVLTLSRGPVAVADGIGYSDADLIMKSCRKDGRLLQPSYPAVAIDAMILQAALDQRLGPNGEVWFAYTELSGQRFGHLLVADLKDAWTVKPSDLGYPEGSEFWLFEANKTDELIYFSERSPLNLVTCGLYDFSLWTIVPFLSVGTDHMWSLVGETSKWVTVSENRFSGLSVTPSEAQVTAVGSNGEQVSVSFAAPSGDVTRMDCVFDARQSLVISSSKGCLL